MKKFEEILQKFYPNCKVIFNSYKEELNGNIVEFLIYDGYKKHFIEISKELFLHLDNVDINSITNMEIIPATITFTQ